MTHLLQDIDAVWIALALLAAMFAVHTLCWRIGRRDATRAGDGGDASLGPLDAAISLLMGLILAFSFSMASARAVQRADLVIAETNAVDTAYRRCALLDEETRVACETALRRFVDLRIQIYEAGYDLPRVESLLAESDDLLDDLWTRVIAMAHRVGPSAYVSLVLAAVNDVTDRNTERVVAARRYVPTLVSLLELSLCLVWAGFTGYSLGAKDRRYRFGWGVFALLIVIVVYITFDFDRQQRGLIRQQAANQALYQLRGEMTRR